MSAPTLQACVDRHLRHAAFASALDDALGTHHGLAWADFVLLTLVRDGGGTASSADLARRLGVSASHLLLRLLPLEKTGLVERAPDGAGRRRVALRAPGRQLLREASDTAAHACATVATATPA